MGDWALLLYQSWEAKGGFSSLVIEVQSGAISPDQPLLGGENLKDCRGVYCCEIGMSVKI